MCLLLLQLNSVNLREVSHQQAVSTFHGAGETVKLLVERGAEERIRVRYYHHKTSYNLIIVQCKVY